MPSPTASGAGEALHRAGTALPPVRAVLDSAVVPEPVIFVNLASKLGIPLPAEKPAACGFGRRSPEMFMPRAPTVTAVEGVSRGVGPALMIDVSDGTIRRLPLAALEGFVKPAPAIATPAATAATSTVAATKLPLAARVLAVDDESTGRLMINRMATKAGLINVTLAVDGTDALMKVMAAIAEGNPYRVIFMDQMMPLFDGKQTAGAILALDPKAIIIPATANASLAERATYAAAGMKSELALVKPFTAAAVKAVVDTLFLKPEAPAPAVAAAAATHDAAVRGAGSAVLAAVDNPAADKGGVA